MAPATPRRNPSTSASAGAGRWPLNIPPDPGWEARPLEIPEAFRRPAIRLEATPPERDWSSLWQHYSAANQKRLRECREDYWHRQRLTRTNGDMGDDALPEGCNDRVRCGSCAYCYARERADRQFEIVFLMTMAAQVPLLTIEVELPSPALGLWAPRAAARGCSRAQDRGRLCTGACPTCIATSQMHNDAVEIEKSFVDRVLSAVNSNTPGIGGARVCRCARGEHPLVPCFVLALHMPMLAVRADGSHHSISQPNMATLLAAINKRTIPAGLGRVTVLTAQIARSSRQLRDAVWHSNAPLLAHVVREVRSGYVPTRDEVLATVARLDLRGPVQHRYKRRNWFGSLRPGLRKQTLSSLHIHPLPPDPTTSKRIVDKIRPFAKSGGQVAVQSLYTGDEKSVPESWFRFNRTLNKSGNLIAPVRHAEWILRRP